MYWHVVNFYLGKKERKSEWTFALFRPFMKCLTRLSNLNNHNSLSFGAGGTFSMVEIPKLRCRWSWPVQGLSERCGLCEYQFARLFAPWDGHPFLFNLVTAGLGPAMVGG